jgi:nitrogen regulatory protein P-II 2
MRKHQKKLLVIITEAILEKSLISDAKRLGAQGYTVHDVRGGSQNATHEGSWDADKMIEMKIMCDESVADALASHVISQYASNYGVSLFFSDIEVIRPQKF